MTAIVANRLVVKRGEATLLDDLSLSFGATGSVALIGPNGAGKSTLLKVLAGLEAPNAGAVSVQGRALASMSAAERVRTIGFLPQHFEPHWDLAVRDLVRLGAERGGRPSGDAVEQALTRYELGALAGRRWSTLSGGENARVLLAMVLVADPAVLLADEPAAALDIRHRLDVVQALAERGRDRLSVVVVHDLDLAFRFFERVVVLVGGKVMADAPAAELLDDPRLDEAFGVRFERIRTPDGTILQASRTTA
ncbi:MAG: ABC transporter ATP-binding protein [Proteobacteria bacterium]|nr:ABC transporter ATP-binding protein [Pseudomonadota bacterium]MBS0547060.1 ABC transporter ATP-binding protein [Pseudomonadota bacterium]